LLSSFTSAFIPNLIHFLAVFFVSFLSYSLIYFFFTSFLL
jgi:hypothetical protein